MILKKMCAQYNNTMVVSNRFEEETLQYLRNIVAKLRVLTERVSAMESTAMSLGTAAGTAFMQVKEVVNKLYLEQAETRDDLAEYGGVIGASTFMDGMDS
jgi:serine phosphatase RsbU (regulator of sigma subunit)